ncbi:MAG TPA: M20 aminoacylase family protein [Hyphomicrobiaceae bacterium]|nr:M20 aminoacylase family protein [Hyphomicrobiaceae bacterium]
MPIINRVAAMCEEVAAWRRDFHAHPEIGFAVERTAGIVAEKLKAFGCDAVVAGVGKTGVVALIKGRRQDSGAVVGLRADMDALPILEATGVPYASKTTGKMHACGHDGHTAMLLGAARYLCETRNFNGTVAVIFQPNEEGLTGGLAMIEDGLMERFGIQQVYGMHTSPNHALGSFAICAGPMLAACDKFTIEIKGKGAHAARPHEGIDPVVIAAQTIMALQTIASRTIDPLDAVVVSTCMVRASDAFNIIPESVGLTGTIRSLSKDVRAQAFARVRAIAEGTAASFGATAQADFEGDVPVTNNEAAKTNFVVGVAAEVVGPDNVKQTRPIMGAEDFSHMLNKRPGAFIMIGNGIGPGLHNPAYNFNDEAIPIGVSYWARLAETAMPI